MDVTWDLETGWPDQINFNSRISALTRWDRCSGFKIGISGDPVQRSAWYKNAYDEMRVIYQTSSSKYVRDMEAFLIQYYKGYCDNEIGGGGGRLTGPPYYLYVVRCF